MEKFNTLTNQAKFIKLVSNNKIEPALKSYADTLLFYYLGSLAITTSDGNILEIGVGGSTYPLLDLSERSNKKFVIVDLNQKRLDYYSNQEYFSKSIIEKHLVSSLKLDSTDIKNLSYCHLDGSKDYKIAINDLEFCTKNLVTNGLICQDDYGNNKWPAVTSATQDMIYEGKLKMLLVGDSSAWLTRPEYYDYWQNLLSRDVEFDMLSKFLNITDKTTSVLGYRFMHAGLDIRRDISNFDFDYFDSLLTYDSRHYLRMPYTGQSRPALRFTEYIRYNLTDFWNTVRQDTWPVDPPRTEEDINNLPTWIKDELVNTHKVNPYNKYIDYRSTCDRSKIF